MKYAKILAVFGAFALLGAGSAVVLESFGTISGTADVERPVEIEEIYYESNFSNQGSGEYVVVEVNADSVSSENFGVEVSESTDLFESGEFHDGDTVVFYENDSSYDSQVLEKKGGFEYVELEDFSLVDSGQYVNLTYEPESAEIHSVEYDGDCNYSTSYYTSNTSCASASHRVYGGDTG
jgi:hypothetical protein